MNKVEFAEFAAALKSLYPREDKLLPTPQSMEVWYRQLADIPAQTAALALSKWASTERWSPSIADIRALCTTITAGRLPDWTEGWAEVLRAVSRFGYMNEAGALESMTELTRTTVERMGWKEICLSDNTDVLRAQFQRVYETIERRSKEDRLLSPDLKRALSSGGNENGLKRLFGGPT